MKKIFSFITGIIMVCGLLFSSCLDVLDVAPDGNLTLEEVLADANKTGALVSACYDNLPERGWTWWYAENMFASCSDDCWTGWDYHTTCVSESYQGVASASYHPIRDAHEYMPREGHQNNHYWHRYWEQIRKCSQVIELVDESAATETNKRLYQAEARVLRAWFYLELVKYFGKLPVLDATVSFEADFSTMKRETVYDVVTKCIAADCDAAIASAELPWRIDNTANAGRVTKALAHTIKATAYLFAASPLHNGGNDYWEETYQVCRTAVNELKVNGYELFTVCTEPAIFGTGDAAAFHQLVCREMDYPQNRDRETIWQLRAVRNRISTHWYCYVGSGVSSTGDCGPTPSQELIDAFETSAGEPVLDLKQPYLDEAHLNPNFRPGTGYNDQDPYKDRDPRMYATALMNGDVIPWTNGLPLTIETYEGGAHAINFDPSRTNVTRTGYFHRKMAIPGCSPTNELYIPLHKFFRLAELILTYAEAAAEAGHLPEAKAAVDEVRNRVKMPPLPALSQDDLILRIRNERRVELAYEQQRYFDLRRWQKPDGNIEFQYKRGTGMLIRKQPDGSFTYQRVSTSSVPRYGYETKDLLFPLPLNEAALLESVTGDKWQNPGW